VYGYRRVHAELTVGHGLAVGEEAVWLLMRKAGLQGLSGPPAYGRIRVEGEVRVRRWLRTNRVSARRRCALVRCRR
jgi:hypothetical protein